MYKHHVIFVASAGESVGLRGGRVGIRGESVEIRGGSVEIRGESVDMRGGYPRGKAEILSVRSCAHTPRGRYGIGRWS